MSQVEELVDWILKGQDSVDVKLARLQTDIQPLQLSQVVERLQKTPSVVQTEAVDRRMSILLANWLKTDSQLADEPMVVDPLFVEKLQTIYDLLRIHSVGKGYILGWMARNGDKSCFRWMLEKLCTDPPADPNALSLAIVPLFTHSNWNVEEFFGKLFTDPSDSLLTNLVIDLANHRSHFGNSPHPLTEYRVQLVELLNTIVDRLEVLQQVKPTDIDVARANALTVEDSVAFIVSICHALGQIGDRHTITPLKRVLTLGHRRARCEGAYAMACLGDPMGEQVLVELANQPLVRKRVLEYCQELNIDHDISPEFKDSVALAEASLVQWLAHPKHFAMAPTDCKLIDRRKQSWPGFENETECMLFQFSYESVDCKFDSIAIAEPCTFAFRTDLTGLTPTDCYKIFAGFDVENENIYMLPIEKAIDRYRSELSSLQRTLPEQSDKNHWLGLGCFFGDRVGIGQRIDSVTPCYFAWDGNSLVQISGLSESNINADLFWYWYVGHRLFESFSQFREAQS
jgi:hypothetical protein